MAGGPESSDLSSLEPAVEREDDILVDSNGVAAFECASLIAVKVSREEAVERLAGSAV